MSNHWILHIPHAGAAVLGIVEADWFYENRMRFIQDINTGNPILVSFFLYVCSFKFSLNFLIS